MPVATNYSFRASTEISEAIEEHFSRLMRRNPGVAVVKTHAITSLILRGAEAFREDDERKEEAEDK